MKCVQVLTQEEVNKLYPEDTFISYWAYHFRGKIIKVELTPSGGLYKGLSQKEGIPKWWTLEKRHTKEIKINSIFERL